MSFLEVYLSENVALLSHYHHLGQIFSLNNIIFRYRRLFTVLKKDMDMVAVSHITEITITNLHYCKQLLGIVDQLRHLDGIIGSFYVSDKECLVPEIIHKSEKPASQIIYSDVKDTVKQQRYVFETLWNKAVSAQDEIDAIEKGKLLEITEIIRNPAEVRRLAYKLVGSAEKEILLILASVNAFMRHVSPMSPASN